MTFITAAIIGAVATAGATAYSSKQARKAQRKAREDQQLRDLIEGAAPNISAVEEIMAEEIGQQDAALLDDALKQMDYQTQQAQEGADFAAQAQADQMLQQALTEEEALQAKEWLWKTLLVACMARSKDLKRDAPWTENDNSASTNRCKILGRDPTDLAIPANLVETIPS